jgi:hypothetical protein
MEDEIESLKHQPNTDEQVAELAEKVLACEKDVLRANKELELTKKSALAECEKQEELMTQLADEKRATKYCQCHSHV